MFANQRSARPERKKPQTVKPKKNVYFQKPEISFHLSVKLQVSKGKSPNKRHSICVLVFAYAHLHTSTHNSLSFCVCVLLQTVSSWRVWREGDVIKATGVSLICRKQGASAAFWHQLFMSSQKHCEADEATDLWVPEPRGFSMGLMCEESQLKIIVTETWGMKGTQPEQRDHRWRGLRFWKARIFIGIEIKAITSRVMPRFRYTQNLLSSNLMLFCCSSQLVALWKGV